MKQAFIISPTKCCQDAIQYRIMWPFKHKKTPWESRQHGPHCSLCGSTNTRLVTHHGTDHPDYVRIWRGQRSLTFRCYDCGRDCYAQQPHKEIIGELLADNQVIDDEEALREAKEETERQIEEYGDRRCR
jgi:hypothetical protein